ncbi:hypothetical protein NDU88_002709 [Pleurodeles waltl]|uniref:Uncharacterized protein n=1 Tax=Pleurodeles waltl TaxID=8319 RepID=A0AAV7LEJ7_PLEWA|nr:hypothetical protein NDU88_002709 [Pleurodeles waltl]
MRGVGAPLGFLVSPGEGETRWLQALRRLDRGRRARAVNFEESPGAGERTGSLRGPGLLDVLGGWSRGISAHGKGCILTISSPRGLEDARRDINVAPKSISRGACCKTVKTNMAPKATRNSGDKTDGAKMTHVGRDKGEPAGVNKRLTSIAGKAVVKNALGSVKDAKMSDSITPPTGNQGERQKSIYYYDFPFRRGSRQPR